MVETKIDDEKVKETKNAITGTSSLVAKSTLKKSTKIRSPEQINAEIEELNKFYSKRHNIVKKLLIRQKKKLDLVTWVVVSLAFYLVALLGALQLSTNNFDKFFSFSGQKLAADFIFMPIYLFACLFTVSALTLAIKKSVLTLPKAMDIPLDHYEKSIKRFESNLAPLIIALPFIIFDSANVLSDFTTNNFQYIGPIPELVLLASWILEWIIFANIIWLMAYYVIFIFHITRKYHYDSELLTVILKDELKPIIHVGYEQSILLTIFLLLNILFNVLSGFLKNEVSASFLLFLYSFVLFLLIPIIAVLPIQFVHDDLSSEIKIFTDQSYNRILPKTRPTFVGENIQLEDKVDFVFTDRILFRLNQVHKSHSNKTIYIRILATMAVPAFGYYVNYGPNVIDQINKALGTNFPFIALHMIQLLHFLI